MKKILIIALCMLTGVAAANSLTTSYVGGNGNFGAMFDIKTKNDITITSFSSHFVNTFTGTVEIYYKSGSHVGFEGNPGAWTKAGSTTLTSSGNNVATPIGISLNIPITSGQTYGIYVTCTTASDLRFTNGSGVGTLIATDSNLDILEGIGLGYPFGMPVVNREWNGTINYNVGVSNNITPLMNKWTMIAAAIFLSLIGMWGFRKTSA